MGKIIKIKEIEKIIAQLTEKNKSIVLVGGCFDILHIGHIKFLQEAKEKGDILVVLLESDEKVKKLKGKNRPFFSQKERALMLSSLKFVDLVAMLPNLEKDEEYQQLILKIKPKIIVTTSGDPLLKKKKEQAEMVGGKLKIVPYIKTFSSSRLAKSLGLD